MTPSRAKKRSRAMSTSRRVVSACLLLAFACAPALAQESLPLAAEALVHEREGAVIGCGIRVTGGKSEQRRASSWFDVSVNVFRRGIALAQAVAYELPQSPGTGESRPARVPVQSASIGLDGGSAKLGENSERQDSLVYALAIDEAISLFEAAGRGSPLRVGVKRWSERTASVHVGPAPLDADARERMADCVARIAD